MKLIRYFLISALLASFGIIATVPIWKPILFVNENLLPDTIQGFKTMRLVKGGGFNMGDVSEQTSTSTPVRYIKVSSFYMDETPVTVADFQKYVSAGGTLPSYWNHKSFQEKNIPIVGVSWNLAVDFCNWRSKVEDLTPAYELSDKKDFWGNDIWTLNERANGYRLPTEAEFEYAARGGLVEKKYPWGDNFEKTYANFDNERGIPIGNWVLLADVNTQKENGFGLKGMSGNVWHWCNDWYDYKYNKNINGKNPLGPQTGDTKVLRGGSWGSTDPTELEVHYRNKASVGSSNYDIGFRCVRPVKRGIIKTLKNKKLDTQVAYNFIQAKNTDNTKSTIEISSPDFQKRLKKYLKDNYSHSIYFKESVEKQKKINADKLANLIIEVSLRYKVNPVFTTAVMIAETGIGTVSLARWSNNPLAFNWEMPDLSGNTVVFASNTLQSNSGYYNLTECLHDFSGYITQSSVKRAAYSDLFDFQSYLHNEERPYFNEVVSKVYLDLLGIRVEEDFPNTNVGQIIYTEWEKLGEDETIIPKPSNTIEISEDTNNNLTAQDESSITTQNQSIESNQSEAYTEQTSTITKERDTATAPPNKKKASKNVIYYLVVKEDMDTETASVLAKQLRGRGFPEAGVIDYNQKSAISIKMFKSKSDANSALDGIKEVFSDTKIVALEN